jgi:hypothetical protein
LLIISKKFIVIQYKAVNDVPTSHSAALPIAHVVLQFLVLLNGLGGLAILVLLVAMPTERWIMSALDLRPGQEAERVISGLQAMAIIGLVTIPINHLVLRRLLAIVDTVRAGDPFVAVNAARLQAIAWSLVALQLLGMVIGGIADAVSTPAHPVDVDAGFSISGWLAVLLTFLLARVFAEGTRMRDDLEGTV